MIKCQTLNLKTYKEYVLGQKSCKMLVLDIEAEIPSGKFVFEHKENMTMETKDLSELKREYLKQNRDQEDFDSQDEHSKTTKECKSFDILFIKHPHGEGLAKFFSEEIGVSHVVYFDLARPKNKIDILTKYFQSEYMNEILNRFCEKLTDKKKMNIRNAFDWTRSNTHDGFYSYFIQKTYVTDIQKTSYRWCCRILNPQDLRSKVEEVILHGAQILTRDHNSKTVEFKPGEVTDTSLKLNKYKEDLHQTLMQVRRDDCILHIIQELSQGSQNF